MSQSVVQATCPKCTRKLKIDGNMLENLMRCKFCGALFRRARAANAGAPAAMTGRTQNVTGVGVAASYGNGLDDLPLLEPVGVMDVAPVNGFATALPPAQSPILPPPVEVNPSGLVAKYYERRRRRLLTNLGIAVAVLITLGIVAALKWNTIQSWVAPKIDQISQAIEKEPSKPAAGQGEKRGASADGKPESSSGSGPEEPGKKSDPNSPLLDEGPAAKPNQRTPTKPAGRPGIVGGRIRNYPGRALLVGVKNYIYANPLNPGYRADNSISQDPLGFKQLRTALVRDFGFPDAQVGELSDVAARNPTPPTRGTIEKTITQFLDGSRPQDHIVLVFMGHAVEAKAQHFFHDESAAYLVPIEADPADGSGLIPLAWLYDRLGKCKARQKLLILDVAHLDPEQGMARTGGDVLKPGLMKSIERVPEGVQVWVSCSPGEHSYQFASSGYQGSAFMHNVITFSDLSIDANRALLVNHPQMKEGSLPLALLAPDVNREVTKMVKERADVAQHPKFFGKEGPAPESTVDTPAPSVTVAVAEGLEKIADRDLIAGIIKELELRSDRTGSINPDALPPFWAKNMDAYAPDYKTEEEFRESLKKHPFRAAISNSAQKIQKHDLAFRKDFKFPGDETRFKRELERVQEEPATIESQLDELQARLDTVGKDRATDSAKRWQAHYDFICARLLAKKIYVREYNFAIGNKLKKDSPVIKNKNNNGWVIIPTEKMQQKDTREWEKKRQTLLEKVIKEHPGTPWEVLARREKAAFLGLTIQEAKVD